MNEGSLCNRDGHHLFLIVIELFVTIPALQFRLFGENDSLFDVRVGFELEWDCSAAYRHPQFADESFRVFMPAMTLDVDWIVVYSVVTIQQRCGCLLVRRLNVALCESIYL